MKIGVNARTLSAKTPRGWSRYTSNLFREISQKDVEIFLFSDRSINPLLVEGFNHKNVKIVIEKGWNYLHWEQWVLPKLCRKNEVDLLHCPVHYGLPWLGSFQKILTLHDAIEVAYIDAKLSWWQKLNRDRLYARALNRFSRWVAKGYISVSQFSKRDLVRHYELPLGLIHVVGEGADPLFHPENTLEEFDFRQRYGLERLYFFYIGGLEDRKNIEFLVRSFIELGNRNYDLVLAGGLSEEADRLGAMVEQFGWSGNIHFLGSVEEHFLPSLFSYAECFVYPSLYEGFGLQLLEAFQMDCPVLASETTSLGEIFAFPPGQFDPLDSGSLVRKMKKVIKDPNFLSELKSYGQSRGKEYSWKKAAEDTLKVYKTFL